MSGTLGDPLILREPQDERDGVLAPPRPPASLKACSYDGEVRREPQDERDEVLAPPHPPASLKACSYEGEVVSGYFASLLVVEAGEA